MNFKKIAIGTFAAIGIVTTLGVVGAAGTAVIAQDGIRGGAMMFKTHGGWHGRHGHRGMRMVCSDRRDNRIDDMIRLIEGFVTFTPDQTPEWNNLKASVRKASDRVGQACERYAATDGTRNLPNMLENADNATGTASDVLAEIRPPMEALYAKLSDEQKKIVDDLIARKGHRH